MQDIIKKVQVNIPFEMLMNGYTDRFIELGLNPEIGIDGAVLEKYTKDDFNKTADLFHDKGRRITVHGPFMDLVPMSVDPGIREVSLRRFDQLLDILPSIRPLHVVGHAGYDAKRLFFFKEEWYEGITAFWAETASGIQDAGSRLMLENVYEHYPEDILPILENLTSYDAGFCFDVGHMNVFSKTPMDDWLEKLGPYLGQFHLHDNNGDMDLHLPPGEGNIDFEKIFKFIRDRKPILTLEPHEEEDLDKMLTFYQQHFSHIFETL